MLYIRVANVLANQENRKLVLELIGSILTMREINRLQTEKIDLHHYTYSTEYS